MRRVTLSIDKAQANDGTALNPRCRRWFAALMPDHFCVGPFDESVGHQFVASLSQVYPVEVNLLGIAGSQYPRHVQQRHRVLRGPAFDIKEHLIPGGLITMHVSSDGGAIENYKSSSL